jgi:hypothetical protein
MIYKFSAFSEHALENIRRSQVFCRHYSDFNDPFEFWSIVDEGEPHPERDPERYRRALEAWEFVDADYEEVQDYFAEIHDYQADFRDVFRGIRISCFSREADNLLMWSHYADGLRGLCLEFDEEALLATDDDAQIMDVRYSRSPGYIDAFEYALCHDQLWFYDMSYEETGNEGWLEYKPRLWDLIRRSLVSAFATKPIEWSYEKECRLILQNKPAGPILHSYPKGALRRVIVGQRSTRENRERLQQALASAGMEIPVIDAVCEPNDYRITMPPHQPLRSADSR